jgi:hypothetical protein
MDGGSDERKRKRRRRIGVDLATRESPLSGRFPAAWHDLRY